MKTIEAKLIPVGTKIQFASTNPMTSCQKTVPFCRTFIAYPSVNAKMNNVLRARIHNMGAHHDDDERMNPGNEPPTTDKMAKGICL